jgi:hypothetical protein
METPRPWCRSVLKSTRSGGCLALVLTAVVIAEGQGSPGPTPDGKEQVRKQFADREQAAVAAPYVGVTTKDGREPGLYPIRATGVPTDALVTTATAFLATLTPEQKARTAFPVEDAEWRKWCNVDNGIYVRQGTSLKEMNPAQRAAARELMRATLSAKGLALTDAIRRTDQTLRELNNDDPSYDEELYFFTVMGSPSATEPWGWQLDGHHLIINTFVLGDQVVMTPAFWGGEPIHAKTGKYAGNTVLQEEQDQGFAFMRSLDPAQQAAARIAPAKVRNDIQAEAFKDNAVLDYAGLPATKLTAEQRKQLLALAALFVNNQGDGHARVKLAEVAAYADKTWFAWVGDTSPDAVFYFRIHSPVILIEFDHQQPVGTRMINERGKVTRDHIHVIVRTPNGNDYGKDLLRQHLLRHAH